MLAKKFLDADGLTYFAQLLNDYPNNEILGAVIDAIDGELSNKADNVLATTTTAGLMSPSDKRALEIVNPNVSVTISDLSSDSFSVINAKEENLINWITKIGPVIGGLTRTVNLLNVDDVAAFAYINGSGVVTSSSGGTDLLGQFIPVTPGQDIYYTGYTNPGATKNQSFNRRLHVFDSNQNWIRQITYVTVKGPNTRWSVHGTIPANGAYVRMSWNVGDYDVMVTVGAPTVYWPYYITPFSVISSISLHVSPDGVIANGDTYTFSVPAAAGDVYGCIFNPIEGKLYVTTGHIASYDGETLPGIWWSDRDTYAAGTTPSEGAQVVYELAAANYTEYDVTPAEILLYARENHFIVTNGITTEITYYAQTFAADHFTIYNGLTFGSTNIVESDIAAWNQAAATSTALLSSKADIDSPALTGSPTAPTPGAATNSTRLATTQFVQTKMNNIAPVETSSKASKNYEVGKYLMYNGQLYKVINAISSGESFVVGTNISATDVATELNLLFAQI